MALSIHSPLPNTSPKKCIEIPIQHFPAQSLQRIGAKLQRRGATKSATKIIKSKVTIPPMPPMASVPNSSTGDGGGGFGCGCSAVSASVGASSSSMIEDSNTSSSSPSTGAPDSAALSDDASGSTGFDDDDEQRPSTSPTAIGDDAAVALCATERVRSLFIPLALLDDAEADSAGNTFEHKFGGRFCCLSANIVQ